MKVLVVLRDGVDGRVDLIRKDDGTYLLRQWRYPVGAKICIVQEIVLEVHEVMQLLSTLLDEAESWRLDKSA